MQRILKYNKDKADELLMKIKAELAEIENDLAHMTDVTINWFEYLKGKVWKEPSSQNRNQKLRYH